MRTKSTRDKTHELVHLLWQKGQCVKGFPGGAESTHDLRTAGQVEVKREGLRNRFIVRARGAEIHASAYLGSLEDFTLVKGGERALDRMLKNAEKASSKIDAAQQAELRERIQGTEAKFNRFTNKPVEPR